jgi:BlaI family transcriptional regulator, penicillinase repressor
MSKRASFLPDAEQDVLKILWDKGQGTVREILAALREAGSQWSYATVATLLDRLEHKGMVASDRTDLAFVYRPLISPQDVRARRVDDLLSKLYEGEPGLLVLHLLKSHQLAPEHAREVRDLLDEMNTSGNVRTSGKASKRG